MVIAAMQHSDWEERFWALTHDLVVQMAPLEPPITDQEITNAREAIAHCIVLASVAVDAYKAVLQRHPDRAI